MILSFVHVSCFFRPRDQVHFDTSSINAFPPPLPQQLPPTPYYFMSSTSWPANTSNSSMFPDPRQIHVKQEPFEINFLDQSQSQSQSAPARHSIEPNSNIVRQDLCNLARRSDPPRSQSDLGIYSRCAVCDDSADGYHFSAMSCAACSAFFRRSIADQKTYACTTRSCNVSINSRKQGVICRYCRFQKCILAGMVPEEVQGKRVKPNSFDSSSTSSTPIYTEASSRRNSATPKKNPKNRQPTVVLLSEIINMRRLVSSKRYTDESLNQDCSTVLAREYKLFEMFMNGVAAFGCMVENGSDWTTSFRVQSQFVIWLLFESVQATIRFGGIQTNKLYFADLTSVDADEASLAAVFAGLKVRDPVNMAKIVFPSVQFFMGNVCRDVLNMRLDERETAALLALLLLTQDKPENREAIYDRVFRELSDSTRGNDDIDCLRVGNIVLFISTFIEAVNSVKEFIICWNVFCADK
uniref:Nuclear receptor domain-containing protein n=1 Tax=Panagrellus redivivus TaxID=6233 RepID=A0A7E4UV42_PANRE